MASRSSIRCGASNLKRECRYRVTLCTISLDEAALHSPDPGQVTLGIRHAQPNQYGDLNRFSAVIFSQRGLISA